jgi:hypothetical protein
VSAFGGVVLGTAPVLLQEHLEVSLGLAQVLGVHRAKEITLLDLGVEVRDQALEEFVTTNLVKERGLHLSTLKGGLDFFGLE